MYWAKSVGINVYFMTALSFDLATVATSGIFILTTDLLYLHDVFDPFFFCLS